MTAQLSTVSTRLRVKTLLKERSWTTKILSEKTGISESYLTHIKNGTRRWNEDALKKIAEAFKTLPALILEEEQPDTDAPLLQMIPVLMQLPSIIAEIKNLKRQANMIPVLFQNDNTMFCVTIEDPSLSPLFSTGDMVIISPKTMIKTGDVIAINCLQFSPNPTFSYVTLTENSIVLEKLNRHGAPVVLPRDSLDCTIIGKVIFRYQKFN